VHNVRREPLRRLGLGADEVLALNPGIVHCTASGFHEASALARAPAIDDSIQAATGLASLNAGPDGAPRFVPSLIADKTAGLALAGAMLAALVRKLRTGRGGVLDVPMYDTLAGFVLLEHLQGHTYVPATGEAGYRRVTAEGRRLYRATDGWLTMTPYTRPQWKAFFESVGDAAMAADPRVIDPVERNRHIGWLYDRVGEAAATRSVDEWLALCGAQGIPAFRAVSVDEVAADTALEASGAIARIEHPTEGPLRMLASPGYLDGRPARAAGFAPHLGEHTVQVLREAGYDDAAIAALRARRVAIAHEGG
jgi:formyl-CoA transferase